MAEPDSRRGFAFRARTSRGVRVVLGVTLVTFFFFAIQFFSWLDTVESHNGWGAASLIVVVLPIITLAVAVVLIISITAFSQEPCLASKWSLGLAVAMALLLVLEYVVLASAHFEKS